MCVIVYLCLFLVCMWACRPERYVATRQGVCVYVVCVYVRECLCMVLVCMLQPPGENATTAESAIVCRSGISLIVLVSVFVVCGRWCVVCGRCCVVCGR